MSKINQEKLDKVLNDNKLQVAAIVIYEAADLFSFAGYPDDFCIQDIVSLECVIFGGWNRVVWRPKDGFWADSDSCTPEFIDKFQKWLKKGK